MFFVVGDPLWEIRVIIYLLYGRLVSLLGCPFLFRVRIF